MLTVIVCVCVCFFQNKVFQKKKNSGIPDVLKTVQIQLRADILCGMTWVQTVNLQRYKQKLAKVSAKDTGRRSVKITVSIWALLRENLSSGFPPKRVSNHSPQLQRLARKLKFHL